MKETEQWYCNICNNFICHNTAWGMRYEHKPEELLEKHKEKTDHNEFELKKIYSLRG